MSSKVPKSDQPLSSFGSELLATLRAGADKEIRITFDSPKTAVRFKQRIHQLRQAMKKAQAPGWEQTYRCGVRFADDDPKTLILAPKDSEFRSFLRSAQIPEIVEPPPVSEVRIAESSIADPLSSDDQAAEFLATLTGATTPPPKNTT